jgi:hypothetical protein
MDRLRHSTGQGEVREMKTFLMILVIISLAGCAYPRSSNRVNILYKPDGSSVVYGQFDEQIKKDMKGCDRQAMNRPGAKTGELFSVLFCPPGLEGTIARGFDRRDDLHYKKCMEDKGYQMDEIR